jgi:N-acylneuraminate cytidylyltransferase
MTQAIAILPARGGSKRIPRKNIRLFAGHPAISWPIAAARASGLFERIVVTTDDPEIASVARAAGAETPFVRSADLSDDHSGTTEVIADAVARLAPPNDTPVCCIYATAVFVDPADLQEGARKLEGGADWVLALGRYATPIERAYRRSGDRFVPDDPAAMSKRSQDLAPAFYDVGMFYWARAGTWTEPSARVWDGADGVVIPNERAVDIDTPDDWARAERLFAILRG